MTDGAGWTIAFIVALYGILRARRFLWRPPR